MSVLRLILVPAAVLGPMLLALVLKDSYPIVSHVCLALFVAEMLALIVAVVVHARGKERVRQQRSLLVPKPTNTHAWDVVLIGLLLTAALVVFGVALACPLSRAVIWTSGAFAAGALAALIYRMWPRRADRRPPEVRPEIVQAYREFTRTWAPEAPLSRTPHEGVVAALVVDVAEIDDENRTWFSATVYFELAQVPHVVAVDLSERDFALLSEQVAGQPLQGRIFAVFVDPEEPSAAQFCACRAGA